MKNLLVADYDGTFKTTAYALNKNISAVKKFRTIGNKFMISTGRVFESIYQEFEYNSFSFDYLSCCNANVIFNNNWELIYKNTIDESFERCIYDYRTSIDYVIKKDEYSLITEENPIEYILYFNDYEKRKLFINKLINSSLFTYYTDPTNKFLLHVFSKKIDKSFACNYIANIEEINLDNIYAIGDGMNDIDMITKFNGYAIKTAPASVKFNAIDEYEQVYFLLNDLEDNKIRKKGGIML